MSEFFLLRMRVNGIKSISKEIQLDFYNKTMENFDPELYRVKAIYGENGSGKTGIVTALNIVKKIVLNPDYLSQQENQSLLNEIINKKNKELSVEIEYAFHAPAIFDVYKYSITLTQSNESYVISGEKLDVIHSYTKNKKFKNVFEINEGKITNLTASDDVRLAIERETFNLLNKRVFVIELAKYYFKEKVYSDFSFEPSSVLLLFLNLKVYLEEEDMHEMYLITKLLKNNFPDENSKQNPIFDSYIDKQIYYLDSKGRDIVDKANFNSYKSKIKRMERFLKLFKNDLKSISIEKLDNGSQYKCELILNYEHYSVNREFESTGVKKLIKLYDSLSNADNGGISFIDEMDSNLNDIYLCKMIEYFMYYSKGQLCFTTHNLDPMTILKNNRNSIDFLSSNNTITSWKVTGNAAPDRYYRNGMIENSPFNIEADDFIGMFGE